MKQFLLISIFALFTLFACNPDRIYESHHKDFKDYRWQKSKVLKFKPEISDTISEHKIFLALRHVYGFQFEFMRVNVHMTAPSGKITDNKYTLQLSGPNKEYLSDCAEDICDLEVLIEENYKFNELGTYVFQIENDMPLDYLPNVMEFGLIIERNTLE